MLDLASEGLTDQAIATKLGIGVGTVNTYWTRVREKCGQASRTELVATHIRSQAAATVALLREENARLLGEVERHGKRELELAGSLSILRTLIETAPDAILVVDSNGVIRLVNQESVTTFGYERTELEGMSVAHLIPERFRADHDDHRIHYMGSPERRRMGEHLATVALRKNGEEFPIAATLSASNSKHGTLITCIVRDLATKGYAFRP